MKSGGRWARVIIPSAGSRVISKPRGARSMNWYALMYLLAIAGGTAIMLDEGRRRQLGSRWVVAVLAWSIGGVIGASLPYQLFGDLVAPRTAVGAVAGATIALFAVATLLLIPTGMALDAT